KPGVASRTPSTHLATSDRTSCRPTDRGSAAGLRRRSARPAELPCRLYQILGGLRPGSCNRLLGGVRQPLIELIGSFFERDIGGVESTPIIRPRLKKTPKRILIRNHLSNEGLGLDARLAEENLSIHGVCKSHSESLSNALSAGYKEAEPRRRCEPGGWTGDRFVWM